MNGELEKNLERRSSLIELLSWNSPGRTEEKQGKLRIASASAKIRAENP
jgi:hypothetical protein